MILGLFPSTFPYKTTERQGKVTSDGENGSSFKGVRGKELPVKFTVRVLGKKQAGNSALLSNLYISGKTSHALDKIS